MYVPKIPETVGAKLKPKCRHQTPFPQPLTLSSLSLRRALLEIKLSSVGLQGDFGLSHTALSLSFFFFKVVL